VALLRGSKTWKPDLVESVLCQPQDKALLKGDMAAIVNEYIQDDIVFLRVFLPPLPR
jgi:hypothetical protein